MDINMEMSLNSYLYCKSVLFPVSFLALSCFLFDQMKIMNLFALIKSFALFKLRKSKTSSSVILKYNFIET